MSFLSGLTRTVLPLAFTVFLIPFFARAQLNVTNFYHYFPQWHSDTCAVQYPASLSDLVLPASLMCPDNEPSCYEPPKTLEVGFALMNGCFKALKVYCKYSGRNEIAALMGSLNAVGDLSVQWLQDEVGLKDISIFSTRLTRELLRASTGPIIHRIGSLDDLTLPMPRTEITLPTKALLKIPLIIEKNMDWGQSSTSWEVWLASSLPGLLLSLTEHYARYYKDYTLRPIAGFALTGLEFISFCSICTSENSIYKNVRQLVRTIFHGAQYFALFNNRHFEDSSKFWHFTILSMIEHLGLAAADTVYYKFNEPENIVR